ncbi:MAG TPA: glycosyltransferase [Dehalococcoidia bacterium]|nr:glycosyltransferase [Dehalococcoidia bacterium]
MFGSVPTTPKSIEAYRPIIGDARVEEILQLADRLRGARVLHVNATAFGGGVAEILATLVPLMTDLGLEADWQVIRGSDEFFNVTKAMHNSLQGMLLEWTPQMREIWTRYNQQNADMFDEDYDFVVIHDPQPAGMLAMTAARLGHRPAGKWVWRCHIDLTDSQVDVWDLLHPYLEPYDAAIFTMAEYVKDDLVQPLLFTIPPAIDPLSPKNVPLPENVGRDILQRYGVDPDRPLISQISRFDPWKDPLGVIDVYRALKQEVPALQLVLIASMASDDPEGWAWYERTVRRAGEDYDIHILSNLNGVGNVEVNAFQSLAKVVIQKSVREGFGLVVSEALWKGRPVVAGNVGGIPLQILYGRTGYLVNTTAECVNRTGYLLQHPDVADRMGADGREHVRENFLITRYLRDYLAIFNTLAGHVEATKSPARLLTRAGG